MPYFTTVKVRNGPPGYADTDYEYLTTDQEPSKAEINACCSRYTHVRNITWDTSYEENGKKEIEPIVEPPGESIQPSDPIEPGDSIEPSEPGEPEEVAKKRKIEDSGVEFLVIDTETTDLNGHVISLAYIRFFEDAGRGSSVVVEEYKSFLQKKETVDIAPKAFETHKISSEYLDEHGLDARRPAASPRTRSRCPRRPTLPSSRPCSSGTTLAQGSGYSERTPSNPPKHRGLSTGARDLAEF